MSDNGIIHETTFTTAYSKGIDVNVLKEELSKSIDGEVRFDDGSRSLYATDASNYKQIPIGVVLPRSEADIIKTVEICRKHNAPILTRGGGTSLAGQCCNVAVVMDFSKYFNSILEINSERKTATVQTGIVLDDLRHATEKKVELTFGPDPATHSHCTIGGMLGNNSCGIHSVMAQFEGNGSRTSDNLESMTVLTYDGIKIKTGPTSDEEYEKIIQTGGRTAEIYKALRVFRDKYADLIREKFPDIPRRVSGYNLPDLLPENGFNVARALVGSEGTLVTILDATLSLVKNPGARVLLVIGYPDIYSAGKDVPQILRHKPIGLEGLDDLLTEFMKKKNLNVDDLSLLPEGKGWLLVEFGGLTIEEAEDQAQKLVDELNASQDPPQMKIHRDESSQKKLWEVRESGLGATAWVPGEPMSVPGWEDSAVDPKYIGHYLKDLKELFKKYGYNPSLYGHFGQGCVHCRVAFDLFTVGGLEHYKKFTIDAAHLVVKYGGSLSGEHGDGQARGELLEIMYGPELVKAFHEFKRIWDPEWKMNPGKIIDSYGQLANLRISNTYDPKVPKTHFSFAEDNHSFAQAALRCVGVGKCRRKEGGTMCPSYMVTLEEEHSTRGRARMLYEMLQGDVLKDGWKNEHVKDALNLCLACKGCKGDCPVNVDMATYKAEFLSHYFKGKLRPASAYAFGYINRWARMAAPITGLANFFTQTPFFSRILKSIAGISQKRKLPAFAKKSFRSGFKNDPGENSNGMKVILWVDTFNNYFQPDVLSAGLNVLKAAGFTVVIPKKKLCCGRPLYDFGLLDKARRQLREILTELKTDIEDGTPIVGLEPSCVAVFRDELKGLFPSDHDARRLSNQVFTLGELLNKYAPDFNIPPLNKKAMLHGHCHQKAIMKMEDEKKLIERAGIEYHIPDSGCCGMAGYFGYENGRNYDVSVAAGERVLLPLVREADQETLIITDGFSCREQIEQLTQSKGIHTAQAIWMALQNKGG